MSTIRVYEFSKQYGIPSKNLLSTLDKGGFHVNSHMSVLTQQELDYLHKEFNINTVAKQPSVNNKESVPKQSIVPEKKADILPTKQKSVSQGPAPVFSNLSKNVRVSSDVAQSGNGEIVL